MGHLSTRLRRAPSFVIAPALAASLLALPTVDTAPTPTPVEPELATVDLDGVESASAASADMPDEVDDDHAEHAADAEGEHDGHADDLEVAATIEPTDTDPYRLVAVTWDDPDVQVDELEAWIRYRSDDAWSDWYPLPSSDGHAPDPGSTEEAEQRDGTEPLVVPESDGVQVRVDTEEGTEVDDLRVDLIDPGVSPADASAGSTAPSSAEAATQPRIFTRAEWGADERLRGRTVEYGQIQAGFVHHTVNTNDYQPEDVPAIIRGIYAFHVKSRGYRDVGYNFLIDKWGRIWEGRYGGIDKPVTGAHTYGHNDDAFAASTIGTYTDTEPTAATLDAYARLFAWKFDMHGVDPSSRVNLDGTRVNAISGHRDTYATACPGDRLYAKLPQIRTATAGYMTDEPGTSPTPPAAAEPTLTVTVPATRLVTGSATRLSVVATGVRDGATVVLRRRVPGQKWKLNRETRLGASGTTSFRLAPRVPRLYRFKVVVRGEPRLVSQVVKVRVVKASAATAPVPAPPAAPAPGATTVGQGRDVFARPSNGVFQIRGHGWGHGRGMSQWGARQAAVQGAREPQITGTYYPGTQRSRSTTDPLVRVLLTADTGGDVIVRAEPGLAITYTRQNGTTNARVLPTRPRKCAAPWWRVRATASDLAIDALCGQSWRVWRSAKAVDGNAPVVLATADGLTDVARRLSSGFERKGYRGAIVVYRTGSSTRAVNAVRMEDYLRAVVPNEMPSSWPQEALRAQAVAARSYAMREMEDRAGYFDVYDTTASQVYPGARLYDGSWRVVRSYEASSADAAIAATRGVHLRYAGRPAFTQFSSSNGGVTATGSQPYLALMRDPWDDAATTNSRLNWTDSVSATALERAFPQIGRLARIRVTNREGLGDWGGRVLTMVLEGSRGSVTVSGDSRVRAALGTNSSYLTFS